MSRGGQVFLSSQRLWWRMPTQPVKELRPDGIESALRAIGEFAVKDGARAVTIWLGGDLCRLTLASPVGGAKTREEAEAALTAALRMRQVAKADEVARLNEASSSAERPVVLVKGTLAEACDTWQPPRGVRLQSVKPWWSAVAPSALEDTSSADTSRARLLALFDGECLTMCAWDAAGKMTEAATQASATAETARRMMTRRALDQTDAAVTCVSLAEAGHGTQPAASLRDFAFGDRVVVSDRF